MPVRSSDSSVLRWPGPDEVIPAARSWAASVGAEQPTVRRIGLFGSYARGYWGVGSDLDLVAIVDESSLPFERRALDFDLLDLPVPADLLVYTEAEFVRLRESGGRFAAVIDEEVRWVYERGSGSGDHAQGAQARVPRSVDG